MRKWLERELPLAALAVAFWPAWQWLAIRVASDSADAWGLVSFATAGALLWRDRAGLSPGGDSHHHSQTHSHTSRAGTAAGVGRGAGIGTGIGTAAGVGCGAGIGAGFGAGARARWTLPIVLTVAYAASFPFTPPLLHAIIAMTAITAACSSLWSNKPLDLRLWGLLLLALPLVPTLNFYLGYPLRVLVGDVASALLQLNGLAVTRDGAALVWDGKQVSIDAPCSGIKMLWTGLYSSCALAMLLRLEGWRFVLLVTCAVLVVLLANILRATALFYVEAGFLPQAAPAHEAIGVVVFAAAAILIALGANRLRSLDREELA